VNRVSKIGDCVRLGGDEGIVACSIDTGEFSVAHPEALWGYLKKGVIVEFPKYGLIHYAQAEPDLRLIARADG
jgi:hypothetical protein